MLHWQYRLSGSDIIPVYVVELYLVAFGEHSELKRTFKFPRYEDLSMSHINISFIQC